MQNDDDGFGKHWDYRIFSQQWTCPDDWNRGQRYLTVHRVDYIGGLMGDMEGTHDHPIAPHDLVFIDHEGATPGGVGIEEYLLDLERIGKASDKPVLIKAEWQSLFDHSEKCERDNARRHARYRAEQRARDRVNRQHRLESDRKAKELEAKFKAESDERIRATLDRDS